MGLRRSIPRQKTKAKWNIVDLGCGESPRRITEMALRCKKGNFLGIDTKKPEIDRALKELGHKKRPANLKFRTENVIKALEGLRPNSVRQFRAEFFLGNASRKMMFKAFREIKRCLVPNGKFVLIQQHLVVPFLEGQLREAGFRVSSRPLPEKELRKMRSDIAKESLGVIELLRKRNLQQTTSEQKRYVKNLREGYLRDLPKMFQGEKVLYRAGKRVKSVKNIDALIKIIWPHRIIAAPRLFGGRKQST